MAPRAGRPPRRLVTLTSDLGWAYAAQMKGAILRDAPDLVLVDLTHDLPRHRIPEAAFVLRAMASPFPAGTIHVAVVDPGVGGRRAPIVLRCRDGSLLVGPDNGVLGPLAEQLGSPHAFRLKPARLGAEERVGTTFDGRDLFAPAAARLARGVPPGRLGAPAQFKPGNLPEASRTPSGARGEVVHVDHFGNLITNVPTDWIRARGGTVSVSVDGGPARRLPWVHSYEALGIGRLGLLGSSFGTVELAVSEGNAARRLGARTGTPVALATGRGGKRATERVNSAPQFRRRHR